MAELYDQVVKEIRKYLKPPKKKVTQKRVPREGEERRSVVVDRLSGKSSKQDVGYRPSSSSTKASCSECEHYGTPGDSSSTCRRVAGVVYGVDKCDLFVARAAESAVQPTK